MLTPAFSHAVGQTPALVADARLQLRLNQELQELFAPAICEQMAAVVSGLLNLREGSTPTPTVTASTDFPPRGEPVAICPTGLVEALGEDLLPYKTGAVRIAAQAGVPLVPMRIRYGNYPGPWVRRFSITTQNILLFLLWPFYRRGATVTFGEPFRVAGLDAKAETAELRRRMLAL